MVTYEHGKETLTVTAIEDFFLAESHGKIGNKEGEDLMTDPVTTFDEHKEAIRRQIVKAAQAFQRLARIDLGNLTRENAAELYQEFAAIEYEFEGVGGILDLLRHEFIRAGEAFLDHLESVGFAGERVPTLVEDVENEGVDAFKTP